MSKTLEPYLSHPIAVRLYASALCLFIGSAYGALAQSQSQTSPNGDTCRKEICDGAVAGCMRADQSLNPFARTEAEKKQYCGQFYVDCLGRTVSSDFPWYSPETVAQFLRCPP
jgi:hypothetical protein